MSEEIKVGQKTRRAFVKSAAQVAVTAPAVALLLNASTKPASAQIVGYLGDGTDTSGADAFSGVVGAYDESTNGTPGAGGATIFDDLATPGDLH